MSGMMTRCVGRSALLDSGAWIWRGFAASAADALAMRFAATSRALRKIAESFARSEDVAKALGAIAKSPAFIAACASLSTNPSTTTRILRWAYQTTGSQSLIGPSRRSLNRDLRKRRGS